MMRNLIGGIEVNERPLYPRYELIDEFRRAAEGQTFHIVRFSRFLELFEASQPAVEEVKAKEDTASLGLEHELMVVEAFLDSKFKFRTLKGIIKDTGIEKERCNNALLSLEKQGILAKKTREDGSVRWYLIPDYKKIDSLLFGDADR